MPTSDASTDITIRVTSGSPTAEEVAAVTAVLLAGAAGRGAAAGPRPGPAWSRAARLEAVGGAPFASAGDPRLRVRPSGAPAVTASQ